MLSDPVSVRYKKGAVVLYDVRTGAVLHRLHGHQDEVSVCCVLRTYATAVLHATSLTESLAVWRCCSRHRRCSLPPGPFHAAV